MLVAALATVVAACGQAPAPPPSLRPEATLAWGPTATQWDEALADAEALTDAEASALVVMPGFAGTSPEDLDRLLHAGYGGVLLQGGSLVDEETVTALTRAARARSGSDRGTLVALDQEGGNVDGLGGVLPSLPSFMAAGAAGDPQTVSDTFGAMGLRMVDLGFTLDFAPVADVTIGPQDPTIASRAASDDPGRVTEAVLAASAGLSAAGVVPVVKHFPGHGSVMTDSHLGLPVQEAAVAELAERDLVPFVAAIDAGAPAVMMGHIVVPEWSDEPATLAPAAYAYLRDELGFDGLVVTDALTMAAAADGRGPGEIAVLALAAGADVLLAPADPSAAVDGVAAAVGSGTVPRERLTEAAARVILLARWQQQLVSEATARPDPDGYALRLAAAGLTVAAADCALAPLTEAAHVTGGFAWERHFLSQELGSRGIEISPAGTRVHLSQGLSGASSADVVVAVDAPWWLETVSADTYLGLYGRSRDSYVALAEVLTGRADAPGTWPVDLSLPYEVCAAS
ncbi:MAG: glycoside hydrolase family 3 N-terminal domain-containing protein [Propioniciclava sp.]